jgi:HSP20 family protein
MKAIVPAWKSSSLSQNWFNEFDQLFDSFFDQRALQSFPLSGDIDETEKFILFSFDLPGLDEKDFKIEVKDNVLSIHGERSEEFSEETTRRFRGRRYGSFHQSFGLPKTVDQDKIEADYTNGVLKILLPKKEVTPPKKVEVKTKKGGFLSDLLTSKDS